MEDFEVVIAIFCLVAWIWGFWSVRRAMIGLTLWTIFCVAMCFSLFLAARAAHSTNTENPLLTIGVWGMLLAVVLSITIGPILALLFGFRSKQSPHYPARKAYQTYQKLTPEGKERVKRGGLIMFGLLAGFLADHMKKRGSENAARVLGNLSQRI